jgi:hypothetical protein
VIGKKPFNNLNIKLFIMRKSVLSFIVVGALIIGFTACNNPSQPYIKFRPGNHLHIDGSASVTLLPDTTTVDTTDRIPTSAVYTVRNGTIKKTYKWSVSGDAKIDSTFMYKDLKAAVTFPPMSADSTVDTVKVDDGTHNGSLAVKVYR